MSLNFGWCDEAVMMMKYSLITPNNLKILNPPLSNLNV